MDKIIMYQFFILLLGTLFAWGNFVFEFVAWRKGKICATCVADGKVVNPFRTPCFYGAIFFTIAFVLSMVLFIN
ncbi:MAG: hypothetical protein WC609_03560 [Candidatus Paceibacterota bacterium]|jgi:hypothetical protein